MFLINLKNMEQRKAFCNLATALIDIDGKQDQREITFEVYRVQDQFNKSKIIKS